MKNKDWQYELHERISAGDPTASAEIYEKIIAPLIEKRLKPQYPIVPSEDIEDITLDAFINYIQNPSQYDPLRGKTLAGYLQMSAVGDIKNFISSARYKRTVQLPDESVVREGVDYYIFDRNLYVEDSFVNTIASSDVTHRLQQLAFEALPKKTDQAILTLILRGESDTCEYAHVLEIEDFSKEKQRAIVKRNTDRIKKVLRRLAEKAKEIL